MISRITPAFAALFLSGLAISGCSARQEGYYDVAPKTAFERVRAADIIGFRDERQCGMLIYFSATENPPNSIKWRVTSDDIVVAAFTLRFTPQGKGTVITIDVPRAPNGGEIYDGKQHYFYPALMQPLRPALRELVDAAIAGRHYDYSRIPKPFNTDGLCGGLRGNFVATGKPFSINDPSSLTHEQAQEARSRGVGLQVESDPPIGGE